MSYFKKMLLTDGYGFGAEFTPMDEMRVVNPVRLVGSSFSGATLDANFWITTGTTGVGAVTPSSSQVVLRTATAATDNGAAVLTSARVARYIGGAANRFRAIISMSAGATGNVRKWGFSDGVDGAYFKLDNTTLSVCTLKAGSEATPITSTSWNGSTVTPTITDANAYEIYIMNRKVYFVINGTLVHTSIFLTTTWSDKLTLPIKISNVNTAVQTDNTITVRTATIYRLGEIETAPIWRYINAVSASPTVLKGSAGRLHHIINTDNTAGTSIQFYDSLTNTNQICDIDLTKAVGTMNFDLDFQTGLSYICTANTKLTVVFE